MFRTQGGGCELSIDLKWLVHKIWMLKTNFKLVGQKAHVQNFKKFA